jgi:hypothetical protein
MNTTAAPMQYLDKAMNTLHDMGLAPTEQRSGDDPMLPLLNAIAGLDEERVAVIARTLAQASTFNTVVRQQVQAMEVGTRFEEITNAFNSIRQDAKAMVDQLEDGKVDTFERVANVWMKATRGDIPSGSIRSRPPISTSPTAPTIRSSASSASWMRIRTFAER